MPEEIPAKRTKKEEGGELPVSSAGPTATTTTAVAAWKSKITKTFVNAMSPQMREALARSQCWKTYGANKSLAQVIATAKEMQTIGTLIGQTNRPLLFACLLFRLLQLQPTHAEVSEGLVKQENSKYARVLGLVMIRLLGNATSVKFHVAAIGQEDFRKIRIVDEGGEQSLTTVDAIADTLLEEQVFMGITLPLLLLH